ncbi:molybdenum cofactor guanylyltransferase [uncultured Jatrophihabitans sp.]|uniref:molybdenum cofactor guanylyltransferase n=1 Tax=uncultured Jatrophihabitans sp. TaxID=1610747 RepID=UPI0035C95D4A
MYDAIVLAGGAGRRLGGTDKPALDVGGASLLARVLDAAAGATRIVVVGPQREIAGRAVQWCQEQPPGGGPVAALATAAPHISADTVLVLAADLPWIAGAVPALLGAVPDSGAALLVDADGRVNNLAGAWRRAALLDALAGLGETRDASMRALLRDVPQVLVRDVEGHGADCDTWTDVEAARRASTLRP